MKSGLQKGLLRCGIVLLLVATACAVFAATRGAVSDFLYWFDFLSPVPGLSGLAILAASPVIILLLLYGVHWILAGFTEQREGRQ